MWFQYQASGSLLFFAVMVELLQYKPWSGTRGEIDEDHVHVTDHFEGGHQGHGFT